MNRFLLLICILVPTMVSGQWIKLGVLKTYSNNDYLKNAFGASIYLDIKIKHFELSAFMDGTYSTNEFSDCDTCFGGNIFDVNRRTFGININHNAMLSKKFSFLKGISFVYIHTENYSQPRYVPVSGGAYYLDDLGIEIDGGIRYNQVFNFPISVDFFLRPTYTFNVGVTPNNAQTSLSDNQLYLKPELSLVFLLDEMNRKFNKK